MKKTPISAPAKYASAVAVGFADPRGELTLVASGAPLPVTITNGSGPPTTPLVGKSNKSAVIGPFLPSPSAPMHLQLSGEWKGRVTLERSVDGGATRQGLTVGGIPWGSFGANVNEPVWQEVESAASLWLNVVLESGELTYRLAQ